MHASPTRRPATALALAAALVAAALGPALAADRGVLLRSGDRVTADLAPGDEDAFDVEAAAGGRIRFRVDAPRKSAARPRLRLFRPDGTEVALGKLLRGDGTRVARIGTVKVPEDATGRWQLRVAGADGSTGEYRVAAKVDGPPAVAARGIALPPGGQATVPFVAETGAVASVRVAPRRGATLGRVAIRGPDGAEVPGASDAIALRRDGSAAGRVEIPGPFGAYEVVVEPAPEAAAGDEPRIDVRIAVKAPRREKRRDTLPPEVSCGPLLPPVAEQRETGLVLDLQAANLLPGTTAVVEGGGVTVQSLEVADLGTGFLVVDAASDAPLGPRRLVLYPPETLAESFALPDAITVVPPGPQLGGIVPGVLPPGASRRTLRITGEFFNGGTTVEFYGGDVTVHDTAVVDAQTLDVVVSVGAGAPPGARTSTITPGPGGGPPHTFRRALTIAAADAGVSSFSHATLARGAVSVSVAVTGRNFRSGDTVAASGAGVTFSNVVVEDESRLTALADVAADAVTGPRDLTVTHAAADGGRAATLRAAFRVVGAAPRVTSVHPSAIGVTGAGGPTREIPVEVTGTDFMTGATVTVSRSGGTGLSVVAGSVRVVSDTTLTATFSLAGAATTGLWDLRVANPGGPGDSGTSGNGAVDVKPASALTVNRVLPASGGPWGGERVTIHGSGFSVGCTVDFGTSRAAGTQVLDAATIVTTVPAPASVSATAATAADVTVTAPGVGSATLRRGWTYAPDDSRFRVVATFPAQDATGVVRSLRSAVLVLSAPLDPSTGTYGTTTGTHCFWFESGGGFTPGGLRAVGPGGRFLVLSRTAAGSLPLASGGIYVLDVPGALRSRAGSALVPARLAITESHDQYTFTISSSALDGTAPTLTSVSPANGSTGQDPAGRVVLQFGEALDPATVSLTTITFRQGAATVPAAIALSDDLRTVTITPENELAASTTYTTTVTSAVADLSGNAFASLAQTFTTASADTTRPTIDSVTVEALPSSVDGSGTYVGSNGTGGRAFDVLVPRDGWSVVVAYSDAGGAGVDATTFSARCSAAVGGNAANAELASNFAVTATGASWRIPASARIAAGDDVTFTFLVRDRAGNQATARTVTVDVADADVASSNGGDLDALDARRTWVLRTDVDAFTATFASSATPSARRGATTAVASDGVPDLDEALLLIGLGSASPTAESAAATNGLDLGTNAIVRRLFLERFRELLNERFGIGADGTRTADSPDVEFLLPGEQGSLAAAPSYSSANTSDSNRAFSEISIGGTLGAETDAYAAGGTIGEGWFDARNRREEANLNLGGTTDTGVFLLGAFKLQVNANTLFRTRISDVLVAVHGGTPVGEDPLDDDVLADTFDRTASTNAARNARYDAIHDALEHAALYASAIAAHEIGHSLGLVPDGAPPTGLFGAAHHSNPFTEATSASPNTTHHLDFLGNDLMAGAATFDAATWTGSEFKRFSPLDLAYLRNRVLADDAR